MSRILYKILMVVSFGFYVHSSVSGAECPGHLKNAEDFQREQREKNRENDPMDGHETPGQKKSNDDGSSKWVKK